MTVLMTETCVAAEFSFRIFQIYEGNYIIWRSCHLQDAALTLNLASLHAGCNIVKCVM
jgi:hypothetical protein